MSDFTKTAFAVCYLCIIVDSLGSLMFVADMESWGEWEIGSGKWGVGYA